MSIFKLLLLIILFVLIACIISKLFRMNSMQTIIKGGNNSNNIIAHIVSASQLLINDMKSKITSQLPNVLIVDAKNINKFANSKNIIVFGDTSANIPAKFKYFINLPDYLIIQQLIRENKISNIEDTTYILKNIQNTKNTWKSKNYDFADFEYIFNNIIRYFNNEDVFLVSINKQNSIELSKLKVKKEQQQFSFPIMMAMARGVFLNNFKSFAIIANDNIIGFISFADYFDDSSNDILGTKIYDFFIDKNYQGKGYGRKALLLAIDRIKSYKNDIYISVHNTNIPAIKLYEKVGFEHWKEKDGSLTLKKSI